ncbi:hypothetical protein HDU98_010045 [Podochytrium sp. JEL0797]|nr:hypothetical protein HDU98_010045 [Podochytrium sp. JEL0797]
MLRALINRGLSTATSFRASAPDALVLGATKTADGFALVAGSALDGTALATLKEQLTVLRFSGSKGETRLVAVGGHAVCVVGMGEESASGKQEQVRSAAASAVKTLQQLTKKDPSSPFKVALHPLNNNARATAEGALLAAFKYKKSNQPIDPIVYAPGASVETVNAWHEGSLLAKAQNTARHLMETPANLLTPTLFATRIQSLFHSFPNTTIHVHDQPWIESHNMNSFLSVSRGSAEPPRFVEIKYQGNPTSTDFPIALVGKGVTFDSGGISIKPSAGMSLMKGDMGGAAVVTGAMEAIAKLQLPINIVACIPMTENMPSGTATKPGDVVIAMNGKSIEVDNTDAEGRLILADAINYACKTYSPKQIVELATLTGAMDVALGYPYAGVFTTSDTLWNQLDAAGKVSGEGLWRMPMDVDAYKSQIESTVADLKNVGGRSAGSITAAIFLQEFVEPGVEFAHIDIAGVMEQTGSFGFLPKGMTGRPVRAIVEYVKQASVEVN